MTRSEPVARTDSHASSRISPYRSSALDKTRPFHEDVPGFRPVVADTIRIREGGCIRHLFFDVGRDQLIVFMESDGVAGVPVDFDAGVTGAPGVPAGDQQDRGGRGQNAGVGIEMHFFVVLPVASDGSGFLGNETTAQPGRGAEPAAFRSRNHGPVGPAHNFSMIGSNV
ncbi:MAG: hypothetical protein ACJ8AI_07620 [Rhodopila sp.]